MYWGKIRDVKPCDLHWAVGEAVQPYNHNEDSKLKTQRDALQPHKAWFKFVLLKLYGVSSSVWRSENH